MKKNKSENYYSIESIKKVVEEMGYDLQDLEDIEVMGWENESGACEGTCISCQSGCQMNS